MGGGAQKVSDPRLLASPLCRESVHEKIKLASFAVMMMIAGVNVPFKNISLISQHRPPGF